MENKASAFQVKWWSSLIYMVEVVGKEVGWWSAHVGEETEVANWNDKRVFHQRICGVANVQPRKPTTTYWGHDGFK